MNDDASPRRYKVSFECSAGSVGTLISVLIKDVESPKMEQTGDNLYKVVLVCMQDQLPTIYATIIGDVSNIVSSPFVPETRVVSTFKVPGPKVQPVEYVPQHRVTIIPPKRKHRPRGSPPAKVKDSATGKAVLTVFEQKQIGHIPDFSDALERCGYRSSNAGWVLNQLVKEGILVRHGWGAYRMATAAEQAEFMRNLTNSTEQSGE